MAHPERDVKDMLNFTGTRFKSEDLEHTYRQQTLHEEKRLVVFLISIAMIFVITLFFTEIIIHSADLHFIWINFLRAVFICITLVILFYLFSEQNENKFDILTLLFSINLSLFQILVSLHTLYFPMANILNILIITSYYITLPNKLLLQSIPCIILFLSGILIFKPDSLLERNTILLIYIAANAIGVIFSIKTHKNRRIQFYLQRKKEAAYSELEKTEKKYRRLIEDIQDDYYLFSYDIDGKMTYLSQSNIGLLKEPLENIIGRNWREIYQVSEETREMVEKTDAECISKKTSQTIEFPCKLQEHGDYVFEVQKHPVFDESGNVVGIEGIAKDITKTKNLENELIFINERLNKQNKSLDQAANRDALTGIYNRRSLYEYMGEQWSRAVRNDEDCSIVMLDIDHFKKINDTYGHKAGDEVLIILAQTLSRHCRPYDRVGRWGGEEFILFLPGTNVENAEKIAERLKEEVSEMALEVENGSPLSITISMGVSNKKLSGSLDMEVLINQADGALYHAKENGRNRVCVFENKKHC